MTEGGRCIESDTGGLFSAYSKCTWSSFEPMILYSHRFYTGSTDRLQLERGGDLSVDVFKGKSGPNSHFVCADMQVGLNGEEDSDVGMGFRVPNFPLYRPNLYLSLFHYIMPGLCRVRQGNFRSTKILAMNLSSYFLHFHTIGTSR